MDLFRVYLKKLLKVAREENCRCLMIGDKTRFAPDIIAGIDELTEGTRQNSGMTFIIAINYGGRDELRRAVEKIVNEAKRRDSDSFSAVTEQMISNSLDTAGIPDPDLLIRTSGELRVSNFLLWQIAYSEIYVTETLWPDFDKEALEDAVLSYNTRDRRFGGRKV